MTKREKMAILAAVVYLTIMSIGMIVLTQVFHMEYGKPSMLKVLVYPTFLAVLSSLIIYYKFFRGTAFKKPKWNLWILEFAIVAIGMLVTQVFLGDYKGVDMGLVWLVVGTMFMVGIGEEMLFRGLIFGAFKERGVYKAILMSGFVFGFLHITNIFGGQDLIKTLEQMGSAGLTGILFAWVFYKTKSIIPTMIYHWFWDMFGLLGEIVSVDVTTYIQAFQNIFTLGASLVLIIYIVVKLMKGESGPVEKVASK